MKIYLDNFDPKYISKKFKVIECYYRNSQTFMELVSNTGIYHVENNKFYKLKPVDRQLKTIKDNIIVDESYFEKELVVSQIPTEYLTSMTTTFIYSFNEKSILDLHVEGYYKNINVNNSNSKKEHPLLRDPPPPADLDVKYHFFISTDFYFCIRKGKSGTYENIETFLESSFFSDELKEWTDILMS